MKNRVTTLAAEAAGLARRRALLAGGATVLHPGAVTAPLFDAHENLQ